LNEYQQCGSRAVHFANRRGQITKVKIASKQKENKETKIQGGQQPVVDKKRNATIAAGEHILYMESYPIDGIG